MSFVTALVIVAIMFCIVMLIIARMVTKTTTVGNMVVTREPDTGKVICRLELDEDPRDLLDLNTISFKVVKMEVNAE